MASEGEIAEDFRSALQDLTINSKPLINMLTMLAEENSQYATEIIKVIKDHLYKVDASFKMPILYLIDSIIKNIKQPYLDLVAPSIVMVFCHVFQQVNEKTRLSLYKLRQTWVEIFPAKVLYNLDKCTQALDPAWPITANKISDSSNLSSASNIHVNPKFFPKGISSDQLNPKSSDEETYRQILIAKKRELLKIQQQKLETEIAQTKLKIINSNNSGTKEKESYNDKKDNIYLTGKRKSFEDVQRNIDKDERVILTEKRIKADNLEGDIDLRTKETSNLFTLIPIDNPDGKKPVIPQNNLLKVDRDLRKSNTTDILPTQLALRNIEFTITSLVKEASYHGNQGLLGPEKQAQILKSAATLLETGRLNFNQHKILIQQLQQIFDLFDERAAAQKANSPQPSKPFVKDRFGFNGNNRKSYPTSSTQLRGNGSKRFYQHHQNGPNNNKFSYRRSSDTLKTKESHLQISPSIISPLAIGELHKVLIDGIEREIHFHNYVGLISMPMGLPHVISFKMISTTSADWDSKSRRPRPRSEYRYLYVDDVREKLYSDTDTIIYLNGRKHSFRLGAPSRELFLDGLPYQINFTNNHPNDKTNNSEEINILIDGKAHSIKLIGPAPEVDISEKPFYNFPNIMSSIDTVTCEHCKVYLENYAKKYYENELPQSQSHSIMNQSFGIPTNPYLPASAFMGSSGSGLSYPYQRIPSGQQPPNIHLYQNISYPFNQRPYPFNLNPGQSTNLMNQHNLNSVYSYSNINDNATISSGYQNSIIPPSANSLPQSTESVISHEKEIEESTIDVNSILNNLIKSGILNPVPDINEKDKEEPNVDLELPVIDINDSEALKTKHDGIINRLYAGFQCSSCGLRFWNTDSDLQNKRYAAHLDWHFHQNRKLKESGMSGLSSFTNSTVIKYSSGATSLSSTKSHSSTSMKLAMRAWYYTIDDWCQLNETEDIEIDKNSLVLGDKIKSEIFENQKKLAYEQKGQSLSFLSSETLETIFQPSNASHYNEYQSKESFKNLITEIRNKDEENERVRLEEEKFERLPVATENDCCELCHESFEQAWDEDREEWVLRDAIKITKTGQLFHLICWQDLEKRIDVNDQENMAMDNFNVFENTTDTIIKSEFIQPTDEPPTINIKSEFVDEENLVIKREIMEMDSNIINNNEVSKYVEDNNLNLLNKVTPTSIPHNNHIPPSHQDICDNRNDVNNNENIIDETQFDLKIKSEFIA